MNSKQIAAILLLITLVIFGCSSQGNQYRAPTIQPAVNTQVIANSTAASATAPASQVSDAAVANLTENEVNSTQASDLNVLSDENTDIPS